MDEKLLAHFDRILGEAETNVKESTQFLLSKEGLRQSRKFVHFGHSPLAITLSASDVRILRQIREALC